MAKSLSGRKAWVTGSSRGIGRCIAEQLAQAGCDVAIHGRNRSNLRSSGEGDDLVEVASEMAHRHGVKVVAICGELTDEGEVKRCCEEVVSQLGGLDILVCNAGGANLTGELDMNAGRDTASNFDLESLEKRLQHNLATTALCCREAVPLLKQSSAPRIVTIGSIAGCGGNKTGGHFAPYSLAKAAVHQYTRLLAAELRHDGIPVNCVIPGNIHTPSTAIRFHYGQGLTKPGQSRLEGLGVPADIAGLVSFLCGPGGAYISGQCIRVDGGEQLSPC